MRIFLTKVGVQLLVVLGGTGVAWADEAFVLEIGRAEAPKIDGLFDDEVWGRAVANSGFKQVDPVEGQEATEKTEVKILAGERSLFIGFRCWDSEPDKVISRVMQRDGPVGGDDYVFVLLDPYGRGREGLYFRANANGSKGDGSVAPGSSRPAMEWDAVWEAASSTDDGGWAVEMAIPYRSIASDAGRQDWGVNFGRSIARKRERLRWTAASRDRSFYGMEDAGLLVVPASMDRGWGVDLKPTVVGRWTDEESFELEPSLDVFWQVTPSMAATLTTNTDFAEAEVDQRVVNLTRFPVFFPEKRDFFLEGAEFFRFGGLRSEPLPFHSRTIGLSRGGEKIGIDAGVKLTGRAGRVGLGLMGVGLRADAGLDSDRVVAGRVSVDVFEESQAGVIFTDGDPRGNGDNQLVGVDFNYRNSHWRGSDALVANGYAMRSDDALRGEGFAYGVNLAVPNDPLYVTVWLEQADEGFNPGMGFIRRRGVRSAFGLVEYDFRPDVEWIQEIEVGADVQGIWDVEGGVETVEFDGPRVEISNVAGDRVQLGLEWERDVPDELFRLAGEVPVEPGDYDWWRWGGRFQTASSRPVGLEGKVEVGDYYDGTRTEIEAEIVLRASKYLQFETGAEWNGIDLAGGDTETVVGFAGMRVTPAPSVAWNTLVQYDNVSEEMGLNSRLRWTVKPGSDVFLVFNKGFSVEDGRFGELRTEAAVKVGWTFRF
ncbi:MAG: DUF5916 domain-containing protein [Verrucomicrobiales bacterium]|nr:DUF5916 domain-containing protein [Verrucomicrobiales bacterium]